MKSKMSYAILSAVVLQAAVANGQTDPEYILEPNVVNAIGPYENSGLTDVYYHWVLLQDAMVEIDLPPAYPGGEPRKMWVPGRIYYADEMYGLAFHNHSVYRDSVSVPSDNPGGLSLSLTDQCKTWQGLNPDGSDRWTLCGRWWFDF